MDYLIELVTQVPSLRVAHAPGHNLPTPREEQVVALVAEAFANREVPQEPGLSEHSVKSMFRIFDKLGISTRVELVLYAALRNRTHRTAKVSERRYAQTKHSTLRLGCDYNAGVPTRPSCQENSTLPEPLPNLSRRWTVIASGLLLSALALVMLYTGRSAFRSPLAIVVIAAIGLAAALLQLRLRVPGTQTVGPPIWLNVLGLLCALVALFSDFLHLSPVPTLIAALGAVGCFAVSSFLLFEHLRKKRG